MVSWFLLTGLRKVTKKNVESNKVALENWIEAEYEKDAAS